MVEIECLTCEKTIKMPLYIDHEKYDGQVVCKECKSLLHVRLFKGKVQKYKIIEKPKTEPITSFSFKLPDGTKYIPGQPKQPPEVETGQETEGNNQRQK